MWPSLVEVNDERKVNPESVKEALKKEVLIATMMYTMANVIAIWLLFIKATSEGDLIGLEASSAAVMALVIHVGVNILFLLPHWNQVVIKSLENKGWVYRLDHATPLDRIEIFMGSLKFHSPGVLASWVLLLLWNSLLSGAVGAWLMGSAVVGLVFFQLYYFWIFHKDWNDRRPDRTAIATAPFLTSLPPSYLAGQRLGKIVKALIQQEPGQAVQWTLVGEGIRVSDVSGKKGRGLETSPLQLSQLVANRDFQAGFHNVLQGINIREKDKELVVGILALAGEKPQDLELLRGLLTRKISVLVVDRSMMENPKSMRDQLKSALVVAFHFQQEVRVVVEGEGGLSDSLTGNIQINRRPGNLLAGAQVFSEEKTWIPARKHAGMTTLKDSPSTGDNGRSTENSRIMSVIREFQNRNMDIRVQDDADSASMARASWFENTKEGKKVFRAEGFAQQNNLSLAQLAFIHSRAVTIQSKDQTLLKILFESLEGLSKILQLEDWGLQRRALLSAA
ncbi:MAG: hypothetical protein KCHDKBKB_01732 [Elusimicrobia bacterium]|nr:hypothetical protein [Elusimicrobiota bacterium]